MITVHPKHSMYSMFTFVGAVSGIKVDMIYIYILYINGYIYIYIYRTYIHTQETTGQTNQHDWQHLENCDSSLSKSLQHEATNARKTK